MTRPTNNPPQENPDQPEDDFHVQLERKLKRALLLKDYALSRNLDVPPEVITSLNKAAQASDQDIESFCNDIDLAIKSLTALTYPTTIETVASNKAGAVVNHFMRFLQVVGAVGLIVAMICVGILRYPSSEKFSIPIWLTSSTPMVLSAVLGLLGCMTYIYFNVIGLLSEKAFNIEDTQANKVRLFLGFMLGWIFYFFFCRDAFEALVPGPKGEKPQPILLLVPFLVGFSTRLVVGVLNQAIRAAELTLGLENKGAQLAQRRTQRTGVSSPSP
jgi:hypothetical protein